MSKEQIWWDTAEKQFRIAEADAMTPQQAANWRLLEKLLDDEFERGFRRGRQVAISELGVDKASSLL
jgi:hypothetical protein